MFLKRYYHSFTQLNLIIGTYFLVNGSLVQINMNMILLRNRVFALYFRRLIRKGCYFFLFNRIVFVTTATFISFDFSCETLVENILNLTKNNELLHVANFVDILEIH